MDKFGLSAVTTEAASIVTAGQLSDFVEANATALIATVRRKKNKGTMAKIADHNSHASVVELLKKSAQTANLYKSHSTVVSFNSSHSYTG